MMDRMVEIGLVVQEGLEGAGVQRLLPVRFMDLLLGSRVLLVELVQ